MPRHPPCALIRLTSELNVSLLVQFRVHSVAHLSFVFVNYYFIVLSDDLGCLLLVYQEIYFLYSVFKVRNGKLKVFRMGLSGLEPPTSRLSGVRSNQLSYKPRFNELVHRF